MTNSQRVRTASAPQNTGLTCPQCESAELIVRQCKRLCERCGYVESCEDSFIPNQANPATRTPDRS